MQRLRLGRMDLVSLLVGNVLLAFSSMRQRKAEISLESGKKPMIPRLIR
jgi:hypothetical protein